MYILVYMVLWYNGIYIYIYMVVLPEITAWLYKLFALEALHYEEMKKV